MIDASSVVSERADLLERSELLSTLSEALTAVAERCRDALWFVSGEAGAGKTALLQCFVDDHCRSAHVLWGAADALLTPRPPVRSSTSHGGRAMGWSKWWRGTRNRTTLRRPCSRDLPGDMPTVLVLEDLHWADEATLDVLRLVGRRVESVPALLVASYRDDELDRSHPLRTVLGELPARGPVSRLRVPPLSLEAVAAMAEPYGVDANELYRRTDGNPFFVTEVLAAGIRQVPETVRDAVLARGLGWPGGAGPSRRSRDRTAANRALATRGNRRRGARAPGGVPGRRNAPRPTTTPSPSGTSWRGSSSKNRWTRTFGSASIARRSEPCRSRRTENGILRGSPITPRRSATRRRCSNSHPPRPSVRARSGHTVRRRHNTRGRFASAIACRWTCARTCSSAERRSAT